MSADAIAVDDVFCLHPVPGGATVAALRGLSLRVARGERVVVHGPNGSGKTTLLRVLSGETPVGSGSVQVDGLDLAGAGTARLGGLRRRTLGQVDQHSGRALRPELRVIDNVALQLRVGGASRAGARAAAADALDALGLGSFALRRPATLSAGEAQRVAVCAAVAHGPAVVLADEPTGELDVVAADAVYDLLAAAARQADATLLLVTHDRRASRIADRVVRIRDGRLSEQWQPSSPDDEELVVDRRGWVRLPDAARRATGVGTTARVRDRDGTIVLTPSEHSADRPEPAVPLGFAPLDGVTDPLAGARDVHVTYGDRRVLDGLTLDVPRGTLTVLRGRSGAGKSTLLRLLLGLADPDAGDVHLGGQPLAGLDRGARARLRRTAVAVSTQSVALAETLTVRENLAFALGARGLPADDAATRAVLDALGLSALTDRPARLLSGGERQRVAVARALVVRRPLVVLDEPTSQQDEAHAELLAHVLAATAAAGTGVLCATHDEVLATRAGAVLELA